MGHHDGNRTRRRPAAGGGYYTGPEPRPVGDRYPRHGQPIQETTVADANSGADALEYFGGLAGSLTGEHIPLARGDFVYTIREALGVNRRIERETTRTN